MPYRVVTLDQRVPENMYNECIYIEYVLYLQVGGRVLQHWDHMYLNLDSVQVIR